MKAATILFDKREGFMTTIFREKAKISESIAIQQFQDQSADFTQSAYQEISRILLDK